MLLLNRLQSCNIHLYTYYIENQEVFNYKIAARPDRRREFEEELVSTMDVALGILTACLNIPELKEQVRSYNNTFINFLFVYRKI